jgi:hypothetical protein
VVDGGQHAGCFVDQAWILVVAGDPQCVDARLVGRETAVAEVEAEELGTALEVEGAAGMAARCKAPMLGVVPPLTERRTADAEALADGVQAVT